MCNKCAKIDLKIPISLGKMSENRRGGFFYSHCREHSCYVFKIQKRDFYIFLE